MKKLTFKTAIAASRQKVWDTMLNPDTYRIWVNDSWPGSYYEGKWGKGENLRFLMPNEGGTLAKLVEFKPYEFVLVEQIASINKDGSEDRDSAEAKTWVGSTESYTFTEKNGKTELLVEVNTFPEWASMFEDGWPRALDRLKQISEQ